MAYLSLYLVDFDSSKYTTLWMQANVKSGFNARQFMATEFPSLIVRRAQIHLPEGKDVLDEE